MQAEKADMGVWQDVPDHWRVGRVLARLDTHMESQGAPAEDPAEEPAEGQFKGMKRVGPAQFAASKRPRPAPEGRAEQVAEQVAEGWAEQVVEEVADQVADQVEEAAGPRTKELVRRALMELVNRNQEDRIHMIVRLDDATTGSLSFPHEEDIWVDVDQRADRSLIASFTELAEQVLGTGGGGAAAAAAAAPARPGGARRTRRKRGTRGRKVTLRKRRQGKPEEKRWKDLRFFECREKLWKERKRLGGAKKVWQLVQADDTDFPRFYPSQKGWTFEKIHSWINDKNRSGLSGVISISKPKLRLALDICASV